MPATPPCGGPSPLPAAPVVSAVPPPQTVPPTTRHAAVPIDAREWRIRTESRCNAIMIIGVAILVSAYLTRAAWLGVGALVLGLVLLVASVWLRPALPWRAPARRQVDDADLDAIRPPTAPFPAMPPHDWRGEPVPTAYAPAFPGLGGRVERTRPAAATFPPVGRAR